MTLELGHTHLKPMLTVPGLQATSSDTHVKANAVRVHAHVGAFLVCGQISDVRDPW